MLTVTSNTNVNYNDGSLGLVPSWQFSLDPSVNPNINPFATYPDGVDQFTVQPLGLQMDTTGLGMANPFDSWWWKNRKWLALGSVVILGTAVATGLTAILR